MIMEHMNEEDANFEEEGFDVRYYLFKFLNYWYLFAIAIVVGLVIAYFQNQSTPSVYKVNSSLLIRQQQGALDLKSIVPENVMGGSTMEDQRVHNEIGILRSFQLTEQAIRELDFEVSYYREKTFVDNPVYHQAPFEVAFDTSHIQPLNAKIYVRKVDEENIRVSIETDQAVPYQYQTEQVHTPVSDVQYTQTVRLGETVESDLCKFAIYSDEDANWNSDGDNRYYFVFNSYKKLIGKYHSFDVSVEEKSTILNLSYNSGNVEKARKFLDKLVELYLERSVSKKDHVARETLEFVDRQIAEISDSLNESEKQLEQYQASEQLMNLDILTQKTYDNLDKLQSEKAEIMVRLKYFDYLKDYLKNNKDVQQMVAPSSMGISDPLLQNLISKLSDLYAEKAEMEVNSRKENPYISGLKVKIQDLRKSLIKNVNNLEDKNNIRLKDIKQRISELTQKISQLPVQQRQLFTYERRFELYNELYTYLLKKRSETEVSKAANIPVHEIVDEARMATSSPIEPKPKKNYMIALLLGLVVPGAFILLKDYFNDKITDIESIEKITSFPVLGHIAHSKAKAGNVVQEYPRSPIAEAFRSVRTNYQFIAGGEEVVTTLVTSASQGEGKSFISLNLAVSFAMYEKKTVLVSFDLRRPNLYNFVNIDEGPGLSSYLSNNSDLDDIVHSSDLENLDIIPAGAVPPNPSELIASEKTEELFRKLKQTYSYIILDTPPVGVVTDAFLLVRYTNSNLFVVRHNYTSQRMFESLIKNLSQKRINNVNVVINDISLKSKGYEYHYGYYYNYSYY